MEKNKKNIWGIVFLIWFVLSLIMLPMSTMFPNPGRAVLIIFGQFLLIFGIIIVKSNLQSRMLAILTIFPVSGAGIILYQICSIFGGQNVQAFLKDNMTYLILLLFIYIGIALVFAGIYDLTYLKKHCSFAVKAKCVDIKEDYVKGRNGRSRKVYSPVYEIKDPRNKNGKMLKICSEYYSNNMKFQLNEYYVILINPEKPTEFLDKNVNSTNKFMVFIGALFIIMPVLVVIFLW